MSINKLTDALCKRATPSEKPRKLSDGHGLYLYITPAGAKICKPLIGFVEIPLILRQECPYLLGVCSWRYKQNILQYLPQASWLRLHGFLSRLTVQTSIFARCRSAPTSEYQFPKQLNVAQRHQTPTRSSVAGKTCPPPAATLAEKHSQSRVTLG